MTAAGRDILHVTERCRGGVATYVAAAIRRQRASRRYGAVRLLADPDLLDPGLAAAASEAPGGLTPYRSGRSPAAVWASAGRVQAAVDAAAPAILHLHSSFPGVYGRLRARPRGGPAIVYCPHGWAFEMQAPPPKRFIYRLLERRLAPKADVIVSISEHEHARAIAAGIDHPAHFAIPHGAPPPAPGPRPTAMTADRLNLLFVGRFDRQKGVDLLLDAMRRVRREDVILHLIGAADRGDGGAPDLCDPRVRAHGWVDHADLDAWYAAADAVVMPSRWEGFGLVAIEAMRNDTPVLAGRRGALPEILGDPPAGLLFDPDDAGGLARLIDGLDAASLGTLGARARARYQAAYTEARALDALDDAYDVAATRRAAR